jgi:hypothetical protein
VPHCNVKGGNNGLYCFISALYFLYGSYEVTGTQYNLSEAEPSLNGDPGFIGYVSSPERETTNVNLCHKWKLFNMETEMEIKHLIELGVLAKYKRMAGKARRKEKKLCAIW